MVGHRRVVPAILDRRVVDVNAEVARRSHPVVAPRDDPERHRVLREMGVGELVDRVGDPVPPVLQELGRGARVIDLVEMHRVRLGEPPHPQAKRGDYEDNEQPDVEPVEAAAELAAERPGPVGTERGACDAPAEPTLEAAAIVVLVHPRDGGVCGRGCD